MRSLVLAACAAVFCVGTASAMPATVANLDAHARAGGNRKDLALAIGERVFAEEWPAQVFQVLVNQVGTHVVVGMRVSGTHFHEPISRAQFDAEIEQLASDTFAAVPQAEELDIWTTVPIPVYKGEIVSGDLAKPAWRNVFTISVMRHESTAAVAARLHAGTNVFIDPTWARTAFVKAP